MDSPNEAQCTGSPTFNLVNSGPKFSEWPDNIPGLICKTAPFGYYSSQRFSQCCSGTVYNITSPTTPDDPAYPMSCALFCQVDPKLDERNDQYPYGFSEHFMCLNDGMVDGEGEAQAGEVVCATMEGAAPTSYESSWEGDWQTRSYYRGAGGNFMSWSWVEDGETYSPLNSERTGLFASSTPTSDASTTSASSSESEETVTTTTASEITAEETTTVTSTASGDSEPAATTTGGDSTDDAVSNSRWTLRGVLGLAAMISFIIS